MVITAFTEPWPARSAKPNLSNSPLLEQIVVPVQRNITSPEDMIFHVITKCIICLDGHGNGGLIENRIDIFEQSIAFQVSRSVVS
jgi:hypothetical protein